VELPKKRELKAEKKELEKGLNTARSVNTAGHLNGLAHALTDTGADEKGVKSKTGADGNGPSFLDYLERRA